MAETILMKGNEAVAEAAIRGGCRFFFGYPITPQSEVPEYVSRRLPEVGGVFLQAESEVAAINMVYGAGGAGARVMTSSSSPGISLKQEGISYIAGAEIPCVIVNMVRGGPGLGTIQPAQSDYFQATKGGGHGDYRILVFAPASVQEMVDLTIESFDLADKYRNPVMIMGDGILGQMMEPVRFPDGPDRPNPEKPWATTGKRGRKKVNLISSLNIEPEKMEEHNWKLHRKYREMEKNEVRFETDDVDGADVIIVAYGTTARVARSAIRKAAERGYRVGLLRPITLWPFPYAPLRELAPRVKAFLVVEMSTGQMVDDVKIGVEGKAPVCFHGRPGGMIPDPEGIVQEIDRIMTGRGARA